jgi:hypothetical protein
MARKLMKATIFLNHASGRSEMYQERGHPGKMLRTNTQAATRRLFFGLRAIFKIVLSQHVPTSVTEPGPNPVTATFLV